MTPGPDVSLLLYSGWPRAKTRARAPSLQAGRAICVLSVTPRDARGVSGRDLCAQPSRRGRAAQAWTNHLLGRTRLAEQRALARAVAAGL